MRASDDRVLEPRRDDRLLCHPLGAQERVGVLGIRPGHGHEHDAPGAGLFRRLDGDEGRAVVPPEQGVGIGLLDPTREMHQRVAAGKDLDELVGLRAGADRYLRAEGAQRIGGLGPAHGGTHLVAREQRLHRRSPDHAGCAGDQDRHPPQASRGSCEDAPMHAADAERIRLATGRRPVALEPASGHGAPSNRRWIARFADDSSAFAKIAAFDYTADWLRLEHTNYLALEGHAYLPRVLGWHDDGAEPALVIEDLSGARWPPPWSSASIDAVKAALDEIHATPPPERIDEIFERRIWDIREGWGPMREAPAGALALGLFDADWLAAHIDELEAAADDAVLTGDTLLHCDVRSDNLCMVEDRVVLVDWNWASPGSRGARPGVVAPEPPRGGRPAAVGAARRPRTARELARRVLPGARRPRADPAGAARAAAPAGSGARRVGVGMQGARDTDPSLVQISCTCNTLLHSLGWPSLPSTTRTSSSCSAAEASA